MASLSLYPQSETNLMSNRKVIELLLQLKSAKAHGKNYKKPNQTWFAVFSVIVSWSDKSHRIILASSLLDDLAAVVQTKENAI